MIPLFLFVALLLITCSTELITVETTRGTVQGFDADFGTDTTQRFFGYGQMFLGIPFAKAPLGERRFARTLLAYDSLQPADKQDEDCLYLNVMSPNVSGKYPVMVFIHGGTFTTGGADIYHWKGAVRNLVARGVVVVTIQYRLGLLGLFTTFTENFPPNRGLYDQILALRWVNQEIANFGGDASRITIFGQSAGAASVSDHSLSPLSRGLFHQLIQTSGSTLLAFETIDDPRGSIHQDRARQICNVDAVDWGTPGKDQALAKCLLKATPQELIAYDFSDAKNWNVAIDGAFMPDKPEVLAKSRPAYPVLVGDVLEEAAFKLPGISDLDISNVNKQTAVDSLKGRWPNYDDETINKMIDFMVDGYTNGSIPQANDHMGWARLNTDMFTGLIFDYHLIRDAQWHHKTGNEDVWLFTFAHRSMLPFNKSIGDWIPVAHCADLPYLWFYPDIWETYDATDADFAAAERFGYLWTMFARHGSLELPKASDAMNYFEMGDQLNMKKNWRSAANNVYNEQFLDLLGEFPPITMSDESMKKVKELGEKVVAKWNSMSCPSRSTSTRPTTTTSEAAIPTTRSLLAVALFLSFF